MHDYRICSCAYCKDILAYRNSRTPEDIAAEDAARAEQMRALNVEMAKLRKRVDIRRIMRGEPLGLASFRRGKWTS